MTLAAPRRSGKTHLIKCVVPPLEERYDHIIVASPTLDFNDDYDFLEDNKKVTFIPNVTHDVIADIFEQQSKCARQVKRNRKRKKHSIVKTRCPVTLLILDDIIDTGVVSFGGVVDKIAERGRHIKMSVIITSQRISAVSRSIRLNSDYFIIFSPFSMGEMEKFIEEFVTRDKRKELRLMATGVFDIDYEFIMLDNSTKKQSEKLKTGNVDDICKGTLKSLFAKRPLPTGDKGPEYVEQSL